MGRKEMHCAIIKGLHEEEETKNKNTAYLYPDLNIPQYPQAG